MDDKDIIGRKLLDVLRREENALIEGRLEALPALGRLRQRLWERVGEGRGLTVELTRVLAGQVRANADLMSRALSQTEASIAEARERKHGTQAYSRTLWDATLAEGRL